MVGITGREIAIYLGNRIFVRGFISGKRVLQVKEGDHERDKDKHGVFVDCSERFAFQGFYYFRGIVETQIRVLTGAFLGDGG